MSPLLDMALYFSVISLVSVGGLPAVLPELQRYVVDVRGWISPADFIQLYAIGQAAPGPNMLIVSLIGWKVASIPGAIVALAALCGPAGVIAYGVADLWERFRGTRWRAAIQRAMVPLVVGFTVAGGYVLATPGGVPDWRLWLIAAASAAATIATRVNPLWLLAGGGILGAILL
ncbi:MAG TPA: chromate transporter [Burkholderiales bacterium]|nr:chromate transporter [Burkholderiales bacterium]